MSFFGQSIFNSGSTANSAIQQVLYKILAYSLIPAGFTPTIMSIDFLFTHQPINALCTGLYMLAFTGTLLLLLARHRSQSWSHIALSTQTMIVWLQLFIPIQNTHIITLQFALLVILCSFYILGKSWGFVYSIVTVLPITSHIWLQSKGDLLLWGSRQVTGPALGLILLVNFIFIIFAHYHFFSAFTNTIDELNNRTLLLNQTVKELENSRDDLRQQSQLQKKLIAAITHDIKSPLKYLMLTGKSLYRNTQQQNGNFEESIRAIYASSFQMYHFTNNLLQYAALYQKDSHIVTTVFNLEELVSEKVSIFSEMITSQNNVVINSIDPHLMVRTNKELLSVIIHNLLDNAIKYTVNGQINFSATQHRDKLQLCLQDTGIGMSAELVNWCNNRQTIKDFISEHDGQGLGLAMVKELVGVIEGSITIQSQKDKGTLILLLLPSEI